MNASTLVICRDETDPRRVRIFGTDADHLVLFSDTIPLDLLKEILPEWSSTRRQRSV